MKRLFNIFLLSVLMIFMTGTTNFYFAESISELQDDISDIEQEYDAKMSDLENKQLEYDDLVEQAKELNEEKENTEKDIVDTENTITEKQLEIKELREVEIPDMEEKAKITLKFAQQNINQNMILGILSKSFTNENPLETTHSTYKILEQLNDNLINLQILVSQEVEDEEQLEIAKDNLEIKKKEMEKQDEYLVKLQSEVSYQMSQLEEQVASDEEELAAKEQTKKLYEEAGCAPDDVYGVDCAVDVMPTSASGFSRPLEHGTVTNEYGGWNAITKDSQHSGIDLANNSGTPVYPAAPGQVIYEGGTSDGGGISIILLHVVNGKNYITRYAHLNATYVDKGQVVDTGDVIGEVGETGAASGAHLHFEIEQGSTYVWSQLENPRNYVTFPNLGGSW